MRMETPSYHSILHNNDTPGENEHHQVYYHRLFSTNDNFFIRLQNNADKQPLSSYEIYEWKSWEDKRD